MFPHFNIYDVHIDALACVCVCICLVCVGSQRGDGELVRLHVDAFCLNVVLERGKLRQTSLWPRGSGVLCKRRCTHVHVLRHFSSLVLSPLLAHRGGAAAAAAE